MTKNEITITNEVDTPLQKSDMNKIWHECGKAWTVVLKDGKLQWVRTPNSDLVKLGKRKQ